MTAERALALLVHSRRARRLWQAGKLDVPPELATLDSLVLENAAAGFRRHVLERTHTGVGTLLDAFPRTIGAWRERHPSDTSLDELVATFLDSAAAEPWRETPAHGDGVSLEEAFYQFATEQELGDPDDRATEWLTATIKMLAVDGEPAYTVPARVQRRAGAAWALDNRDPPTLFATVGGRILIGPVTKLVADLLSGARPEEAGPRNGVSAEAARTVQQELSELIPV